MARALLVEDDPWQADCYSLWLKGEGYQVHHVATAQDALDACDACTFHIIVLDMLLPGANGIQLIHQLQSYTDTARTPVIICSTAPPSIPIPADYGVVATLDKTQLTPEKFRKAVRTYAAP